MLTSIKNLFAGRTCSARKPGTSRLRLENLEERQCMSVTIDTLNAGHTLRILGDNNANAVTITQDDDHNQIQVVAAGQTKTFQSSDITAITIDLRGGNDTLTYKLGGGSDFRFAKAITAQLGLGNDTANLDFASDGSGGQADIKANLAMTFNEAGTGNDKVTATFGKVDDVNLTVKTRLGFGNDIFSATLQGDLKDDASVQFDLVDNNDLKILFIPILRGGNDSYTVKADSDVDIDDDARLDVFMFGGDGNDSLNFLYRGEVDGKLIARLDGGNGNDVVLADIKIDNGSDGTLDARVLGGKGNDTVTLKVTDNGDDDFEILTALLDGGLGTDTGIQSGPVTRISCEI